MIGLNYGVSDDSSENLARKLVMYGAIVLLVLGGASFGVSEILKGENKIEKNYLIHDDIYNLQKNLIQLSLDNGATQEDVDNALDVYMIEQSHFRKTKEDILKNVYEKLDKNKLSPEINKKLNISMLKLKR